MRLKLSIELGGYTRGERWSPEEVAQLRMKKTREKGEQSMDWKRGGWRRDTGPGFLIIGFRRHH